MKQKTFCIVGFGNHARSKIIPAINKINGKIIGIVSSKLSIDSKYTHFSSLSKAFLKVNSDTIFIICSPPDLHYSQALEIIRNEHNLFIEKPVAINLIELDEIIKLSNKKKTFFVENFMHEYSKFYNNFIDFYKLEINNIAKIDIRFTLPKLPINTFRHKKNNYPVNLYDIGCYTIALITNLSNEAKFSISKIWNKGQIDCEKVLVKSKIHNIEIKIIFGIDSSYENSVKVTKIDEYAYIYEPFFYGREGNRLLQEIRGMEIVNKNFYEHDCFETLLEKTEEYWLHSQEERNRIMLNTLSSLEILAKQYNDIE